MKYYAVWFQRLFHHWETKESTTAVSFVLVIVNDAYPSQWNWAQKRDEQLSLKCLSHYAGRTGCLQLCWSSLTHRLSIDRRVCWYFNETKEPFPLFLPPLFSRAFFFTAYGHGYLWKVYHWFRRLGNQNSCRIQMPHRSMNTGSAIFS